MKTYDDCVPKNFNSIIDHEGLVIINKCSLHKVEQLAKSLGQPLIIGPNGGLYDSLYPRSTDSVNKGAWTNLFGSGAFPAHTDWAWLPRPPRYMILRLADNAVSRRPTLFYDSFSLNLSSFQRRVLKHEVWMVANGSHRFTTKIGWGERKNNILLRFDPVCMRPYFSSKQDALLVLASFLEPQVEYKINWTAGMTVIVDNWRFLHSRSNGDGLPEPSRILERFLIHEVDPRGQVT